MGGVNLGDPVPIFHEEFAGASSKSLAIVVLEIFASESDGGRTLVAYSSLAWRASPSREEKGSGVIPIHTRLVQCRMKS